MIDREGMKVTLACAVQEKNQVVTRRGYCAHTLVVERQNLLPDLLDHDLVSATTLGQALSTETEVARQAEMRALAKRSLLDQEAQEKLIGALSRKPGGQIREFLPGETIFFWVPRVRKGRYRHDPGEWRGPEMVTVKESHEKYFVSWRRRCLLLAATNMRGSTIEENAEVNLEELQELEDKWQGSQTFEDMSEVCKGLQKEKIREEESSEAKKKDFFDLAMAAAGEKSYR